MTTIDLAFDEVSTERGSGDQPTALLVHGWLGTRRSWDEHIERISARRRVVALDLRGHGESPDSNEPFAFSDMVEDIHQLISSMSLSDVVVYGHSMGSSLVSMLAVRYPNDVAALVLMDPDYAGDPAGSESLQELASIEDESELKEAVGLHVAEGIERQTASAQLRARHRAEFELTTLNAVASTTRANVDPQQSLRFLPEAAERLRARTQPVISFHRLSERAALEESLTSNRLSRAVYVPESGHWLHQEYPDFVFEQSEQHLKHALGGRL